MKTIGRLILAAIFLVLTVLAAAVAKFSPDLVFAFYTGFSQKALAAIANFTATLPFALWEALAVLLILWLLYSLVRCFSQKRGFFYWLAGVALALCAGVFVFVGLWGLNHYGPSIAQRLDLDVPPYSRQELAEATQFYADQVSALAPRVNRDQEHLARFQSFAELSDQADRGYRKLAQTQPFFSGASGKVKKLASWPLFSRFGITGIFVCFTAEPCVNPDTYEAWIPFTMCHELAHSLSVAAEDEANFCAYLACMEHDSPEFQYSGALAAFVYCSNALTGVDNDAALPIWESLNSDVLADVRAANRHYSKYEGKVQDAAQKVNDAYLKAFSEEDGVQSYGKCADLLIAWYQQNNQKSAN